MFIFLIADFSDYINYQGSFSLEDEKLVPGKFNSKQDISMEKFWSTRPEIVYASWLSFFGKGME